MTAKAAATLLCSSTSSTQPSFLQAIAQRHACAVEQHPAVGRGDAEFLTDIVSLEAEVLAHHEHLAGARGQGGEALFQGLQELLFLKRLLGPGLRRLAPMPGLVEQRV